MDTLYEVIPGIYAAIDQTDGSFQAFVTSYDGVHAELQSDIQTLQTCATANACPDDFVPFVANKYGNPFTFMTIPRWQRGDKLSQLTSIYANRGSKSGLIDAIQYLCGVKPVIQLDIEYAWTLGVSTLGGIPTP